MNNSPIVFMGSPEFALPTLRALSTSYLLVGVVTQPDRPSGRGQALKPPPVKLLAAEIGAPLIQPRSLRDPVALEQLTAWAPELIVVAAFGQILRQQVLDLPRFGCINVHASLLPRWRGPAPIQAALLNGDEQTGISIMRMDPGIDTGPVLSQRSTPIQADDDAQALSLRLSQMGAELLLETLPAYLAGLLHPRPQDEALATYAPMLKKEDGLLDFNRPARELVCAVRAYTPWPGAFTDWQGVRLKILRSHAVPVACDQPGKTLVHNNLPAFCTSDGLLVVDEIQPAGKKPMPGQVFLQGARAWHT